MRTTDTGPTGRDTTAENEASLLRVLAVVMISSLMALGAPEGAHLPALSALLFIGAFAAGTAALLGNDPLLAPNLTRWDEAAAIMTLSLMVGWIGGIGGVGAIDAVSP